MYALEFETDITDRFIVIKEYEKVKHKHARVIILVDEPSEKSHKISKAGSLKQYAKPERMENEKEIAWEKVIKEKSDLS